jgi:hypothetical protein
MRDDVLRSKDPYVGLSQAPEYVEEEQKSWPLGLTTFVLALAKPPSLLRGRVYDMREEKVGLETLHMTT